MGNNTFVMTTTTLKVIDDLLGKGDAHRASRYWQILNEALALHANHQRSTP